MELMIILIFLTLIVALIGVLTSKDLPRKVIVTLALLYIVFAVISFINEWRSENRAAKDKAQKATSGKLENVTSSRISRGKRSVNVEFGSSGAIISHTMNPDQNSFRFFQGIKGLEWLPIWFTIDGDRIRVSADIRDSDGNTIAKMVENEWQINEGNTLDRNYTDHAVEVINNKDEVILQVVLLNDRVQIQAKFFDNKGQVCTILGDSEKKGGYFYHGPPGSGGAEMKISRIFLYPSSLHFGERIDP